jgi:bacteriorhodopsin
LLLDLFFLAGTSGGHILMAIAADIIMILTGLFAAYGSENNPQKWGWYAIACIAFLVVIWHLVLNGGAKAKAKSTNLGKFYAAISGYTIVIWLVYPIIWGIADGARVLNVNQEIIAYAVLDILAKPVFGIWLLVMHSRMSEASLEVDGFWTNGLNGEGRLRLDDDEGA